MTQHMNPYKTADELGVTPVEYEALIAVGRDIARDDYAEKFLMVTWTNCICGKMHDYRVSKGQSVKPMTYSSSLSDLFLCPPGNTLYPAGKALHTVTRQMAAEAIQNFLLGVKSVA